MENSEGNNTPCEQARCAVCEENIIGKNCLACVQHDDRLLVVCGPLCEAVFGFNPSGYVRRLTQKRSPRIAS